MVQIHSKTKQIVEAFPHQLNTKHSRNRVPTGYGILEKLWNFEKEIPYYGKTMEFEQNGRTCGKTMEFSFWWEKCVLSLTFTATHYLPSYTPHVGLLDPVTFKEAMLFTCIRVH